MRRFYLGIIALLFTVSLSAQSVNNSNFEHHSFGFGVQFSSFPLMHAYSGGMELSGGNFDLSNAYAIGISGKYEYGFNRLFSLSIEPGYLYTGLSYKEFQIYPHHALMNNTNLGVHQLNIPIIANFRFRLIDNVNFIASGGVNALVSLQKEIGFFETPTVGSVNGLNSLNFKSAITPEIVVKAGMEIETKRRIRLNASYHIPLTNNAYYSTILPIDRIDYEAMNINRLAFELSLFL